MANVTNKERRLAELMSSETRRYENGAIKAAAKIGLRVQRAVLSAWRKDRHADFNSIVQNAFIRDEKVIDELAGSMLIAYLLGRQRVKRVSAVSMSAASNAVDVIGKRMLLTLRQRKELEQLFKGQAITLLKDSSKTIQNRIDAAIRQAIGEGMHTRQGVSLIADAFDLAGITPVSSYTLENIFRTQTQMTYSAAKWQADQDPVVKEILWGYKYVTVGDDRVRPSHELLDGTTLPAGDPFWRTNFPPNGWSCRCTAIELFDEQEMRPAPGVTEMDGVIIVPGADKGFQFNPGIVYNQIDAILRGAA